MADVSIASYEIQEEQILSVDVESTVSLIGLASPLVLTMTVSLMSLGMNQGARSARVVKKGIEGFISTLA